MDAKSMPVATLLGQFGPFRVPIYQRGFAWEQEQVSDYVDDLLRLIADPLATSRHFFGGVVTTRQTDLSVPGGANYDLVDGQQRVTMFTLTIRSVLEALELLKAQAGNLQNDEGDLAKFRCDETIARLRIFVDAPRPQTLDLDGDELDPPPLPRLTLSSIDRDFFARVMRGESPDAEGVYSRGLLSSAKRTLKTRLTQPILADDGFSLLAKRDEIARLATALLTRSDVIHAIGDNPDEANQLFVVLNTRGKELSAADLIRTHTLRLLQNHESVQTSVEELWHPLMQLGPNAASAFLRNYFASVRGHRVSENNLFKFFTAEVFPKSIDTAAEARAVEDRVRQMQTEARHHAKIRAGDWPFDLAQETDWYRKRLEILVRVLKSQASIPFLLSIRASNDERLFREAVMMLERFTFRYNVSGGHASEGADVLYTEALAARSANYSLESLGRALGSLLRKYARDRAFRGAIADMRYAPTGDNGTLKYFLSMLETYYPMLGQGGDLQLRPERMIVFDFRVSNVEHIYPQNAQAEHVDRTLEPLKHDLGNLTFWGSQNAPAGNQPFAVKRDPGFPSGYPHAPTELVKELAQLTDWNADELVARRERLVEWGTRVFALPQDQAEGEAPRSWFVRHDPDSRYASRRSKLIDFPYDQPYARAVDVGDLVVTFVLATEAVGGRRVVGLARIGAILAPPERDLVVAAFDRFTPLDPPATFEDLGGDPRENQQRWISPLPEDVLRHVLGLAGLARLGDLAPVNLDEDEIRREFSTELVPEDEGSDEA
jgi:hypothetical protein